VILSRTAIKALLIGAIMLVVVGALTAVPGTTRRDHAFVPTKDVIPSPARPELTGTSQPHVRTVPGTLPLAPAARPGTAPRQKTRIGHTATHPHMYAVGRDYGPGPPPAWDDAPMGDRPDPSGRDSLPGRAILDKSPNRPARPARHLVIEATYRL
jgi:hypothetical protein